MLQQQIINSQKKRKKRGKKGTKELQNTRNEQNGNSKSMHISIINLNINRLNSPIKKHRVAKQRK